MSRSREAGRPLSLLLVAVLVLASISLTLGVGATPAESVAEFDDRSESETGTAPIDPALENATGEVEILVRLEEVDGRTLTASDDEVRTLQSHAETAQAPLEDYAEGTDGVSFERGFWITNAALVTVDREEASLSELAAVDGVKRLAENYEVEPARATADDRTAPGVVANTSGPTAENVTADSTDVTYGLEEINAPAVWEEFETRGEGTTVAVLDTGVDPDHPDIDLYTEDPTDPTYPGGWAEFDETGQMVVGSQPFDSDTHGTHVSGTVAGGDEGGIAIGVAPEARLIHGKVMDGREGTAGMLYGGIEWAIEQDADVITMSLGTKCGTYESGYIEFLRNARAAGSVPVAAIGNDGEGCTGSPGNVYDTVSVGATNSFGNVWETHDGGSGGELIDTDESWGADAPADWPDEYVTPTVTAPGVYVDSAVPGGGYEHKTGTSMATPHVVGTVALMQSATDRETDPDEIEAVLRETADDPIGETDTRYGDGIVDAYAAVDKLEVTSTITGTVTDDVTGEPIAGATVSLEDEDVSATTESDGTYVIDRLEGDRSVTLVVEADGYGEHHEVVSLPEDETVEVDTTLAGDAEVVLEVEDVHFGDRLDDATVEADGENGIYPGHHDGDGTYTIENVPSVGSYDVSADAEGYVPDRTDVQVTTSGMTSLEEPIALSGDAEVVLEVEDEVTETPIADVAATVEREDGKTFEAPGTTDADGNLEITLPGGEDYTLEASVDGYLSGTDEQSVSSGETATSEIALAGDATLEVDLEDAHFETPITDGTVEAEGDRGTYPGTHEGEGTFTIEKVPGGHDYDLVSDANGYVMDRQPVTVAEGKTTKEPIALSGDAAVVLEVEDEVTETPITDVAATVEREDGEVFEAPGASDADGDFEITLPGGEDYTLEASADGYLSGTDEQSVSSGETAIAEIALAGDATLEVDLEDAHFETPITDGTVEADGEQGTYPGTHEGEGEFVVERVPSVGEYDLTAEAEGYVADDRSATVGERGTNTLEPFALTGDATLSVTVEEDSETPIGGATVSIERDGETFEAPETADEEGGLEVTVPGTGDAYAVEAGADEYETNVTTTDPVGSETTEQVTVTLTAVDEGIPGFGVGITLLALAAALVATRRRYRTD